MKTISISEDDVEALTEDAHPDYNCIVEGEWQDEGKWSSIEMIFQDKTNEKFYALYASRSGSYYSDYEYEWPSELVLVEPREITTIIYVRAK